MQETIGVLTYTPVRVIYHYQDICFFVDVYISFIIVILSTDMPCYFHIYNNLQHKNYYSYRFIESNVSVEFYISDSEVRE